MGVLGSCRMVFTTNDSPSPRGADGGIVEWNVTSIMVQEIEDYH